MASKTKSLGHSTPHVGVGDTRLALRALERRGWHSVHCSGRAAHRSGDDVVTTAMECASMAVEEEAATIKLGGAVDALVDALAQPGRFECLGRTIGRRVCMVLARAARGGWSGWEQL